MLPAPCRSCLALPQAASALLATLPPQPCLPWAPPQAHPRGAINVPVFLVISSPSSPGEFGKWLACKVSCHWAVSVCVSIGRERRQCA